MIIKINESKTLTKNISCGQKCKFGGKNVIKIESGIRNYVDVSQLIQQNMCVKNSSTLFEILVHVLVKLI